MKCLFSIAPEARKGGKSLKCLSLKNFNQTLERTRFRVDLNRRGFCLHVDGEEAAGAASKRCLAGVAARFHLRLEGDKTNVVEWEGGKKQRACCFVFFLNNRRDIIFLNQTECDRKCERNGRVSDSRERRY
jgi:hypothetical protein